MNSIVSTPEAILFKTVATEGNRHTGEYTTELMLEVLEEIGPEKMLADVTDNASAMVKAKGIIKKKYRHIAVYGCCAHCLNLR